MGFKAPAGSAPPQAVLTADRRSAQLEDFSFPYKEGRLHHSLGSKAHPAPVTLDFFILKPPDLSKLRDMAPAVPSAWTFSPPFALLAPSRP